MKKDTFVFCLLGSSLDSIKDDPTIRKGDQPPWICVLLGLQGEPLHPCVSNHNDPNAYEEEMMK